MGRPREHDEALRERLLEATAALLAAEGPGALSVRRIATNCDTSTAAIYTLFGNKGALVRAVYREGFARLGERLSAVELTGDPLARLRAQRDAYFDNALANPQLYAVMFGLAHAAFDPSDDDLAFALSTLGQLVACVQDCIDAGALHGDADDLAVALWAASHGVCTLAIAGMLGDVDQARRHLERVGDALAVGLALSGPA